MASGFAKGEDKLDIADILTGYTDGVDDLADWVQLTDDGTDTRIAVNTNGGGSAYIDVVVIEERTCCAASGKPIGKHSCTT